MKKLLTTSLSLILFMYPMAAQNPETTSRPQKEPAIDDVVRITTELVQTDVVVVDGNERIVPDLKIEDFELYDNGKKQELRFLEFVSVAGEKRVEGSKPRELPSVLEDDSAKGISAKDVKRVIAFVVDDLTIPVQDLPPVRSLLLDFVDNKMQEGDLVAIIRVVGGKGLLQQFTTDRQLLHRAIANIVYVPHPFGVSNTPEPERIENPVAPQAGTGPVDDLDSRPEVFSTSDDVNQFFRGLSTLTAASFVIESLKNIPGRKNLVIISGGIPIFEVRSASTAYSNTTYLMNHLSDRAVRAGVVVNALDPRGLRATPGVVSFTMTPGRSALDVRGPAPGFGRGGQVDTAVFGPMLAGGAEHLGLSTIAAYTGGVSVVNTNDFKAGLDKILARSSGYYVLAYTPKEKFDEKFHRLEVKVRRSGAKVLHHRGYNARMDKPLAARTKEEQIAAAATSALARRDIDITPNLAVKLTPENRASLDIHLLIDANKLNFTQSNDRFSTSLDIVGFVFDQLGRQRGGFSETINLNLTGANYQIAQKEGLVYSATTELPPGNYQLRTVVRESSSGSLGTFSKYLEIPDLKKEKLAMSSLFLFAVNNSANPVPLTAARVLNRTQDLRYALLIYNARLKDGKPQLRSQMIISQGGKVLLREPEEDVVPTTNGPSPVVKIGQFGVSKMQPGRYLLTLIITDSLADKKNQTLSRSLDFTVSP